MDERRKKLRIKEENKVTITVISGVENIPKKKSLCKCSKDISMSGTKIQSHVFLPVGTILDLSFISKAVNQKITVLGIVKWIKVIIEDKSYEAGVEFFGTSCEAINKLGDYISSKQKS